MLITQALSPIVGNTPIERSHTFTKMAIALALICIAGAVANVYLNGGFVELTFIAGAVGGIALILGVTERVLLGHWIRYFKAINDDPKLLKEEQPGFSQLLKVLIVVGVLFGIGAVAAQGCHMEMGGVIFFGAVAGVCLITALLMSLVARNKQKAREFFKEVDNYPLNINVLNLYALLGLETEFEIYFNKHKHYFLAIKDNIISFLKANSLDSSFIENYGKVTIEKLNLPIEHFKLYVKNNCSYLNEKDTEDKTILDHAVERELSDHALVIFDYEGVGDLEALLDLLRRDPQKYGSHIKNLESLIKSRLDDLD